MNDPALFLQRHPSPFLVALAGGLDDGDGKIGVFQVAGAADETGHGAVEMGQELLAQRPLAFERFLVPAGLVEPDKRAGQVHEGNAPVTRTWSPGSGR